MKPGKGAAFVRSKLKNFITNNTVGTRQRRNSPKLALGSSTELQVPGRPASPTGTRSWQAASPAAVRLAPGGLQVENNSPGNTARPPRPPPPPSPPLGLQVEKTWRAGETVDLANVEKKETQFTYAEGDEVSQAPGAAKHAPARPTRQPTGDVHCPRPP